MIERKSWDTCIKHYVRNGLLQQVPKDLRQQIPRSNIHRWSHEPEDKYAGQELAKYIKEELEFIKRIGQTSNIKKVLEAYFKLSDAFHEIISGVKGVQQLVHRHKELVVNSIENTKNSIPVRNALRVFNISRTTYQNYKSIVIHQCDQSYFKWCTRRFPNQLLPKEVETIHTYMKNTDYMFWSKASVYLKAIRDGSLSCCQSTFYNYCRLLGVKALKSRKKSDDYNPVKTVRPNELWCADVTIFKTADGVKHYIHILMDHYSKMILAYRIEKSSNGKAIRDLLHEATLKYKPNAIQFLTDGGSENVNATVASFLNSLVYPTKHTIAQKDVLFSNSMIEALNKVIKHQFLYPKNIQNRKELLKELIETVYIYNNIRPQWSLGGNTPFETFNDTSIDLNKYKNTFSQQKVIRLTQNNQNSCKVCF